MLPESVKLKDIKPALYGYVRSARDLLNPGVVPDEKKVHDLRVLMKKSKAVLKLIAPQTDREFHDREYAAFREPGRISRSWRETSVHRKTLKELKKRHQGIFSRLSDDEKIRQLLQKPEITGVPSPEMNDDLQKIIELLEKSAYRIRFQPLNNMDSGLLLRQLEATYSEVSDFYLTARNYSKAANLHEFRKRAKDFLYQLFFFRPVKPGAVRTLEKKLDLMADNLGKYNDLAVMIGALDYKYSRDKNSDALDELAIIIKQEQDKYLSRVWPSAFRIFCPSKTLADLLKLKVPEPGIPEDLR